MHAGSFSSSRVACSGAGRWEAGEALQLAELPEAQAEGTRLGNKPRRGIDADDETESDEELGSAEAEAHDLAAESARTARAAAARAAEEANRHCSAFGDMQVPHAASCLRACMSPSSCAGK